MSDWNDLPLETRLSYAYSGAYRAPTSPVPPKKKPVPNTTKDFHDLCFSYQCALYKEGSPRVPPGWKPPPVHKRPPVHSEGQRHPTAICVDPRPLLHLSEAEMWESLRLSWLTAKITPQVVRFMAPNGDILLEQRNPFL